MMLKKKTIWILAVIIAIAAVVFVVLMNRTSSVNHSVSTQQISTLSIGETKSDITDKLGKSNDTNRNKTKILEELNQYRAVINSSPTPIQQNLERTVNKNSQSLGQFIDQLTNNKQSEAEVLTYKIKDSSDDSVMLIMENDKLGYVISTDV